jgi:hypothetical protein
MSNVQEIEEAIVKLPLEELSKLRAWFAEFDAAECDQKLEKAIDAGYFDNLAERALKDLKDGKCVEL